MLRRLVQSESKISDAGYVESWIGALYLLEFPSVLSIRTRSMELQVHLIESP